MSSGRSPATRGHVVAQCPLLHGPSRWTLWTAVQIIDMRGGIVPATPARNSCQRLGQWYREDSEGNAAPPQTCRHRVGSRCGQTRVLNISPQVQPMIHIAGGGGRLKLKPLCSSCWACRAKPGHCMRGAPALRVSLPPSIRFSPSPAFPPSFLPSEAPESAERLVIFVDVRFSFLFDHCFTSSWFCLHIEGWAGTGQLTL